MNSLNVNKRLQPDSNRQGVGAPCSQRHDQTKPVPRPHYIL